MASYTLSSMLQFLLQVWVRDVLEAQQVLDYRTGQRFKKSEVPILCIYQHCANCDHLL